MNRARSRNRNGQDASEAVVVVGGGEGQNNPLLINEILEVLFTFLSLYDIKICRQVCSVWDNESLRTMGRRNISVRFFAELFIREANTTVYTQFLPTSKLVPVVCFNLHHSRAAVRLHEFTAFREAFGSRITKMELSYRDIPDDVSVATLLTWFPNLKELDITGAGVDRAVVWKYDAEPLLERAHQHLQFIVFSTYSPYENIIENLTRDTNINKVMFIPLTFSRRTHLVRHDDGWKPGYPLVQLSAKKHTCEFLEEIANCPQFIQRLQELIITDGLCKPFGDDELPSLCQGMDIFKNCTFPSLKEFKGGAINCRNSSFIYRLQSLTSSMQTLLGNMPVLTTLDLLEVHLTPDFVIPHLPVLTELNINETAIRKPDFFARLPALKRCTIRRPIILNREEPTRVEHGARAFNEDMLKTWSSHKFLPHSNLSNLKMDMTDDVSFPENVGSMFPNLQTVLFDIFGTGSALSSFFSAFQCHKHLYHLTIRDRNNVHSDDPACTRIMRLAPILHGMDFHFPGAVGEEEDSSSDDGNHSSEDDDEDASADYGHGEDEDKGANNESGAEGEDNKGEVEEDEIGGNEGGVETNGDVGKDDPRNPDSDNEHDVSIPPSLSMLTELRVLKLLSDCCFAVVPVEGCSQSQSPKFLLPSQIIVNTLAPLKKLRELHVQNVTIQDWDRLELKKRSVLVIQPRKPPSFMRVPDDSQRLDTARRLPPNSAALLNHINQFAQRLLLPQNLQPPHGFLGLHNDPGQNQVVRRIMQRMQQPGHQRYV